MDFHTRETLESAFLFGRNALEFLGLCSAEAEEVVADIRRRDAERLCLEQPSGLYAGFDPVLSNAPKPEPFTRPRHVAQPLNPEADAHARVAPENQQ